MQLIEKFRNAEDRNLKLCKRLILLQEVSPQKNKYSTEKEHVVFPVLLTDR